eukprot:scaffold3396_cov176-Amphora_coffeaeformis.AAC.5
MLRVVPAMRHLDDKHVSDLLPPRKYDQLVVDKVDYDKMYAFLTKNEPDLFAKGMVGWRVCVVPGADPMVMLMLASILEEMVGWFAQQLHVVAKRNATGQLTT